MRRVLRRHRLALLAILCAGIATVLVLLAVDAGTWRATIRRDDVRFRALPTHKDLWQPSTILPGDPASLIIGTRSTLRYRHALQYFWFSRIGSNPEVREDTPTLRAAAQDKLQHLMASAPNAAQRSNAANLLGVLVVTAPSVSQDPSAVAQTLARSAQFFQDAIEIDPGNRDAKENLELVLRITNPGESRLGRDARSGYGFGKGQGGGQQGSGY
ncbi:MAG TPA: hypothetical protein VFA30_00405 [Gaiellaceae bacterium]|nr:hypothetical protein [Gaiellaceae bacterium]